MSCYYYFQFSCILLFFFFICSHSNALSSPSTSTSMHICSHTESQALLQFKHAFLTNTSASSSYPDLYYTYDHCDTSYPKTDSWKENTDCCSWEGVSCSSLTSHVIGLDLSCSQLYGKFPPNSTLFHLKHLKMLNLSGNDFLESRISAEFGQLTNLTHLDLSNSGFSGQVPSEISHLSKLVSLDLSCFSDNYFAKLKLETSAVKRLVQNFSEIRELLLIGVNLSSVAAGTLTNLSSSLTSLDLFYCELKGTIPDSFFRRPNLRFVGFMGYQDQLTVHLPKFNWTSALERLILGGNVLSGQLPDPIGELKSLEFLGLLDCNLIGSIPTWIGNLSQIKHLFLSMNHLTGPMPLFFANLTQLVRLSLSHNLLTGTIPSLVFSLPSLQLLNLGGNRLAGHITEFRSNSLSIIHLYDNMLQGQIPNSIFQLVNLRSLDISHNILNGSVQFPWQNIKNLNLQDNHFEGGLPVPPIGIRFFTISKNNFMGKLSSMFCNLNSLEVLDLSHNNLTGKIPSCLLNYSTRLNILNLQSNHFDGTIPATFIDGCALAMLNLHGNQLQGLIPRSMAICRNLEVLDIGNNNMKDTFPHWLDSLSNLQVLILGSNKFYGFVNNSKESTRQPFPQLRVLDLSSNDFGGSLPTWYLENLKAVANVNQGEGVPQYMHRKSYGTTNSSYDYSFSLNIKGNFLQMEKVLTIFTSIDLSNNNFEGVIPEVVGKLSSLKGLNLSHNQLGGHIPWSIGNLTNLEWLDLSSNKLVGEIPGELLNLASLAVLNLSNNQLVGPIPEGKQFNTFENSSFEENSGLCGFPLSKLCNESEKKKPVASRPEPESGLEFGWTVVLIGYGCGLIIGAGGGCLVFLTGKPKWIVNLVEGKRHRKAKWRRKR